MQLRRPPGVRGISEQNGLVHAQKSHAPLLVMNYYCDTIVQAGNKTIFIDA